MYVIRARWCLVYLSNYFFAVMSTTQQNEEMNNIMKMKVKSHFMLLEFITKYKGVICSMRENENVREYEGAYAPQKIMMPLGIEAHVWELYTNEVFIDFQEQEILSMHYFPHPANGSW